MKIDPRKVYTLKGTVQHYDWGGTEYIPALLGIDNTGKKPFAEYWMGAHTNAPSHLSDGETSHPLGKLLSDQPELLGAGVYKKFQQLPYLFKVLDVNKMLSIQVHPTKAEAEKGFDKEEEKGVAINAPNRNYKDRNHKPEVMIALGDFWLLHGFKPADLLKDTLDEIHPLRSFIGIFNKEGYHGLYRYVMELPQHEVDAMLLPLVQKEVRRRTFNESDKDEPGYWVGEYYLDKQLKNIDKGIFSIYFLNLVHLNQGEGIFQAAGIPHAYLQGQNIELMANSDNVLRGGLTSKHVDITELMKHTIFEAVTPAILKGNNTGTEISFRPGIDDFAVSKIELNKPDLYKTTTLSAEIIICMNGSGTVTTGNTLHLSKGDACIAFAGNAYTLSTDNKGEFYKATVGLAS